MPDTGYLDFPLFPIPSTQSLRAQLKGSGHRGVLVVISAAAEAQSASIDFLDNILKAARLAPTTDLTYRLALAPNQAYALAQACRDMEIKDVLMFGDHRAALGIRAQLTPYTFTRLGGIQYLLAHDLDQLRQEREQGRKQNAGALWQALKTHYLP